MIQIFRMRELGLKDLTFALRDKHGKCASLEPFEKAGLVVELKPENERAFVETLIETHPTHKKNFEHFLINPPDKILPTDVIRELKNRSELIPTLCLVQTQTIRGKLQIMDVKRIEDHYELFSLLSDARADGLIPPADDGGSE